MTNPSTWTAEQLDRLFLYEESGRRYRAKGDWAYEEGRHRACTEYHGLAAQDEARAREIRGLLEARLGPGGEPMTVAPAAIAAAQAEAARLSDPWSDVGGDFAAACFHARHPAWCREVARFREAYAWWHRDARFLAAAPTFRPVNRNWD